MSYKLGVHLEQDPLLYTQGSEFLMPGPLGNLYQVPMNLKVRMLLQLQARKAFEIYRSVNFPRPPADFMVRASAPAPLVPAQAAHACPLQDHVRNVAFRRAPKVEIDEEEDEEDEQPSPSRSVPLPPRGMASLSMSLAHSSMVVARAVSQLGRSLRRHKLRQPATGTAQ